MSDVSLTVMDSKLLIGNFLAPLGATGGIRFPYSPTMSLTQEVAYQNQELIHTNQSHYYFVRNESPQVTISGKFTCQTQEETAYSFAAIHFLRSYTKMSSADEGGLPPPPLILNGYTIGGVPCFVRQFSMDFSEDTDYTVAPGGYTLPVLFTLSVGVILQRCRQQVRDFRRKDFVNGDLLGAI